MKGKGLMSGLLVYGHAEWKTGFGWEKYSRNMPASWRGAWVSPS
jgi:hypothetical protein